MNQEIDVHRLLIQFKHGDEIALVILVERFSRKFYHYAITRKLSHEDAEDVTQQVFVRLMEGGIKTYDESEGGGAAWLFKICDNQVTDKLRSRRGREISLEERTEEFVANAATNPETLSEKNEYLWHFPDIWKLLSDEEKQELLKGRGRRGPPRKRWIAAVQRYFELLQECYSLEHDWRHLQELQEYLTIYGNSL